MYIHLYNYNILVFLYDFFISCIFIISFVFHSILLFLCCISITDDPIAVEGEAVHFQDSTFAERKGENFQ